MSQKVTLSTLPDDCLRTILLHLYVEDRISLAKVCQRWERLSEDCWREARSLTIYPSYEEDCDSFGGDSRDIIFWACDGNIAVPLTDRCAPYITKFEDRRCRKSFSLLPALEAACNLRELRTSADSPLDDVNLAELLDRNEKIERLRIVYKEHHESIEKLPTGCLKDLCLHVDFSEDEESYRSCIEILKRKIHESEFLEKLDIGCVSNDELFKVIGEKTSLKHLAIQNRVGDSFFWGTTGGLSSIAKLPNLEKIELCFSNETSRLITDEFLKKLGANCSRLECIKLFSCNELTDEGLHSLLSLQELRELDVSFAEKIVGKYLKYFTKLTRLFLADTSVNNAAIGGLLRKSQCLSYLRVSNSRVTVGSIKVAIEAVKKRKNSVPLYFDYETYRANLPEFRDKPDSLFLPKWIPSDQLGVKKKVWY